MPVDWGKRSRDWMAVRESRSQIEEAMTSKQLMTDLINRYPGLADQPDVVAQLASSGNMAGVDSALGMIDMSSRVRNMQLASPGEQRSIWADMTGEQRNAARSLGYAPPKEDTRNFLSKGIDQLGKVGNALHIDEAVSYSFMPLQGAMKGMEAMQQTMARPFRGLEYTRSGQGVDPATAEAIGLELPGGRNWGAAGLNGQVGPLDLTALNAMSPMSIVTDFMDPAVWKATWTLGHDGEDDFRLDTQINTYNDLLAGYGNDPAAAQNTFRFARARASGMEIEEYLDSIGMVVGTTDYQTKAAELQRLQDDPRFQTARKRLSGQGHMSFGRMASRSLLGVDTTTDSGVGMLLSGGVDFGYAFVADPTLAAGKVAKLMKAARFGISAASHVDDIRYIRSAVELAERAARGQDVVADAERLGMRGGVLARRQFNLGKDVLSLGEKHRVPAQMIVDAAQNNDWAGLQRALPGVSTSIDSLVQFHNKRGIRNVEDVFDFYEQASDVARLTGRTPSTALFGHDPEHLYLPHRGRTRVELAETWRKMTIDKMVDDPTVVASIKNAISARAAQHLGDPAAVVIDDHLMVKVKRNKVKKFMGGFATQAPRTQQLSLEGNEAVANFTRFVETGYLANMAREHMDGLINLFASGNVQTRAKLVGDTFTDIMRNAGVLDDAQAQLFLRRYHKALNDHYGIGPEHGPVAGDTQLQKFLFRVDWENDVPVPNFDDVMLATKKMNVLRWVLGTAKQSPMETFMVKAWKPAQLMRLGYITRNGGEEMLSLILRTSSLDYLRASLGNAWMQGRYSAGVARNLDSAQSAWVRPFTVVSGSVRRIAGWTDEAIKAKAAELARERNPRWEVMPEAARDAAVAAARAEVAPGRIGTIVSEFDDGMRLFSAAVGVGVHKVSRLAKMPTKQQIGEWILGSQAPDYVLAAKVLHDSAEGQRGWADAIYNSWQGMTPYTGAPMGLQLDNASMALDVDLPMRSSVPVAHADPFGFAMKGTSYWQTQAATPHGRAVMEIQHSFVPERTATHIEQLTGRSVADTRQAVADAGFADRERIYAWLNDGDDAHLAGITDPDLAKLARAFIDEDTHIQRAALGAWGPDVTTDPGEALQRMEDTVANLIRNAPADSTTRQMAILAMGDHTAPLRDGHTRLHVVQVDRDAAEALVEMMNDPNAMAALEANLRVSLTELGETDPSPLLADLWSAAHPTAVGGGWGSADLMQAIRDQLTIGGGRYVPALTVAVTDPAVARAVRNAVHTTVSRSQYVKAPLDAPTLGILDIPDDQLSAAYGTVAVGSRGVYALAPHRVIKAQTLNPHDLQLEHLVELNNGRRVWARDNEIERYFGPVGTADRVPETVNNALDRATMVDPDGAVVVNRMALLSDFKAGGTLLRGGGPIELRTYLEPELADLSVRIEQLEAAGGVSLPDVEQLLKTIKRMPKAQAARLTNPNDQWVLNHPVYGVLVNNGVLADLVALKSKRISHLKGGETRFVQPRTALGGPAVIARAHRELGIDPDLLVAQLGNGNRYVEFIAARERAGVAMGMGPRGTALARDQAELNKLATAYALAKMKIDPADVTQMAPATIAALWPKLTFDPGESYRIVRTVATDGMSAEAAIQRAARAFVAASTKRLASPNGRPLHEVTHHILRGDWDATDMWTKIANDDLPRDLVTAPRAKATETTYDKIVGRAVNGWFGFASAEMARMARHPQTNMNAAASVRQMGYVYRNYANEELADRAVSLLQGRGVTFTKEQWRDYNHFAWPRLDQPDRNLDDGWDRYGRALLDRDWNRARAELTNLGATGTFTDDELAMLRNFHGNQAQAWALFRDASMQRTIDLTVPFIDDHRIRSHFSAYTTTLIPFGNASEQFLKRMGRMAYQTPEAIRKAQLLLHGLSSSGLVREDDYGNQVLVYPGSEFGNEVVAQGMRIMGVNPGIVAPVSLTGRVQYLFSGYNTSDNPFGFSPFVVLPIDQATQRIPELMPFAQFANGGYKVDRPIADYFVPAYLRNLWSTVHMDSAAAISAQADVMRYAHAAGMAPDEEEMRNDPRARQAYLDMVEMSARPQILLKAMFGFAGLPVNMEVEGDKFSDEYAEMLAQGIPPDEANVIMMERHGPTAMAYTVFDSKRDTSAPIDFSEQAFQTMIDNPDLFEDMPLGASWLLVARTADRSEYSFIAHNQAVAFGLRHRRTPDELLDALYAAEAGPKWSRLQDEHLANLEAAAADPDAVTEENERYTLVKEAFNAAHPVWAANYSSGEGRIRREATREQIRALSRDARTGKHPNLESIAPLELRMDSFERDMAMITGRTDEEMAARRQIEAQTYMDLWIIAQRDLVASAYFNQVLRYEFDEATADDFDEVLEGAMT